MEGISVLIILTLLILLGWFVYHFGDRILDAFSPVRSEYGIVIQKEYTPPHTEVIARRVVRSHGNSGFSSTSYDIPEEIQVAEEYILHLNLNGRFIVTPVIDKLYDSVNEGDRVFVKYAEGRFSKKIYLKRIKLPHIKSSRNRNIQNS